MATDEKPARTFSERMLSLRQEQHNAKADTFPCAGCDKPTHIDDLDAKDDGTGNYTVLQCKDCYGPGWVHGRA